MKQMRSDFEKWLSEWIGVPVEKIIALRSDDPDEPYFSEDHDEEALQLITIAYQAWQASRATIVISIGPDINPLMFNDDVLFGYQKGKDEVTDSIRAAGLRVKEK